MARPNLSSLFSKFIFRETLTSQDKTDIRGDIGAEESGAAAAALVTAGADATSKADAAQAAAATDATTKASAAAAASQPLAASLTAYAAAVSSAARRALFGAVGTAAEITTALQGAEADSTKIGAEYMPASLPVDSLTYSDQSGVLLDPGETALDDNGRVIVGNGVKNVEVGSSSRLKIRNAIHIPAATITGGATYQEIGRFKLRNTEWVLGQRAVIIGRFGALASAAYAGSAFIGVRPSGATTSGFRDQAAVMSTDGAPGFTTWMAFVEFKAASSGTKIVIDEDESSEAVMGIRTKFNATAGDIIVASLSSASTLSSNGSEPATATDIVAYINLPQDAAFTGYVRAFADLEIIFL